MTNRQEMLAETMIPRDFNKDADFMKGISVRNTFLDVSEDPWTVTGHNIRRLQTDSILHQSSSLGDELAGNSWKVDESQLPAFPTIPMPIGIDMDAFVRGEKDEEDSEEDAEEEDCHIPESLDQKNSPVDPKMQAMRELAANGGGVSGCTTVMMRQVPLKYTQRKLLREINNAGFTGQFDFLYLPMDPRSHANRGFAFINMVSVEAAEEFYKKFHGQFLRHFNAEKSVIVLPADLQGFEENALQYAANAHLGKRTGHTKPIFFRPLPRHIEAQLPKTKSRTPAPPMQPSAVAATHRMPERPMPRPEQNVQEMAIRMLQQAFLPAMVRASQSMIPPERITAERQPSFCVYCGKRRLPDHMFCAYCGRQFDM
jgi:hypothetical protein